MSLPGNDLDHIEKDILKELEKIYKFKSKGQYYRGECPECQGKKAWTKIDQPFVIFCSSENSCGAQVTARELFPDLFENFSERYPATKTDPNATAFAYLASNRGFNVSEIKEPWQQGYKKLQNGEFAATVRFPLWDQHYWERIIDRDQAKKIPNGRKAHFSYNVSFKDKHWPSSIEILDKDSECFIVEGIFHQIALRSVDKTVVSAFTCTNLPRDLIKANKGRNITWCLAYDNDTTKKEAGREWALRYYAELIEMGEKVDIYLSPGKNDDWDECLRRKVLTSETFWNDCKHRGRLLSAEDPTQHAYFEYIKYEFNYSVFSFRRALYSIAVNPELIKALKGDGDGDEVQIDTPLGYAAFRSNTTEKLVTCVDPQFLYLERDDILNEQFYTFRIRYKNGHSEDFISIDGGNIESPGSFNKTLLQKSAGGSFEGSHVDMRILRQRWFRKITTVSSIPFIGYDVASKTYVFKTFAVHNGREISLNDENYFKVGRKGIKSSFRGFDLSLGKFSSDWFENIYKAWGCNGVIALAMWTSTLFAQQIRAEYKSLPFFELTGAPGAGKSTLLRFLWRTFGRGNYEGFDPNKSRPAGRRRTFAQVSNLPVVLIESDRDDGVGAKNKAKGFDWDELKPLYDGGTLGTLGVAKRGNDTEEPIFQGCIVISQNASVDASDAMLERIVHLHFETAKRETVSYVKALDTTEDEDLSGYLTTVIKNEKNYLKKFKSSQEKYSKQYWDDGHINYSAVRLILNHSQVMASIECLSLFFPKLNKKIVDECNDHVISRMIDREDRIQGDHPTVREFWSAFDYLNGHKNEDYRHGSLDMFEQNTTINLNHSPSPTTEIKLNLNHFNEVCRRYGQPLFDLQELRKALISSRSNKYVDCKKGYSAITKQTMQLWTFKVEAK